MYQYKKRGTSNWINCPKAQFEAYSKYPLNLRYAVREQPPLEGLELAEVKPKKKTTKKED